VLQTFHYIVVFFLVAENTKTEIYFYKVKNFRTFIFLMVFRFFNDFYEICVFRPKGGATYFVSFLFFCVNIF